MLHRSTANFKAVTHYVLSRRMCIYNHMNFAAFNTFDNVNAALMNFADVTFLVLTVKK